MYVPIDQKMVYLVKENVVKTYDAKGGRVPPPLRKFSEPTKIMCANEGADSLSLSPPPLTLSLTFN